MVGHTAGIQAGFSLGFPRHSAHRATPSAVCSQKFTLLAQCHPQKPNNEGLQGCGTPGQEKPGTSPAVLPKVFVPGPG